MWTNPIRACIALSAMIVLPACGGSPVTPEDAPRSAGLETAATHTAGLPAGVTLPWRIRATVATTPAAPPAGCLIYFTAVIEGTATHLGKLSGVGSTCITGVIQPDPNPPFVPAGPPPYFTAEFTNPRWTLTASNGDELWLEAQAVAVISLTDGSLRAQGTQLIIGGTGRFAGAAGEAMVGAVNDDGQGADDFEGSGWIRFAAADGAGH